jgi:hypothetical protein
VVDRFEVGYIAEGGSRWRALLATTRGHHRPAYRGGTATG